MTSRRYGRYYDRSERPNRSTERERDNTPPPPAPLTPPRNSRSDERALTLSNHGSGDETEQSERAQRRARRRRRHYSRDRGRRAEREEVPSELPVRDPVSARSNDSMITHYPTSPGNPYERYDMHNERALNVGSNEYDSNGVRRRYRDHYNPQNYTSFSEERQNGIYLNSASPVEIFNHMNAGVRRPPYTPHHSPEGGNHPLQHHLNSGYDSRHDYRSSPHYAGSTSNERSLPRPRRDDTRHRSTGTEREPHRSSSRSVTSLMGPRAPGQSRPLIPPGHTLRRTPSMGERWIGGLVSTAARLVTSGMAEIVENEVMAGITRSIGGLALASNLSAVPSEYGQPAYESFAAEYEGSVSSVYDFSGLI